MQWANEQKASTSCATLQEELRQTDAIMPYQIMNREESITAWLDHL